MFRIYVRAIKEKFIVPDLWYIFKKLSIDFLFSIVKRKPAFFGDGRKIRIERNRIYRYVSFTIFTQNI